MIMLQSIIITNSHGTYNMEIIVFTSNSRHNNSQLLLVMIFVMFACNKYINKVILTELNLNYKLMIRLYNNYLIRN